MPDYLYFDDFGNIFENKNIRFSEAFKDQLKIQMI